MTLPSPNTDRDTATTTGVLRLQTFIIRFATNIQVSEVPLLRGAIIHATGGENTFFHNHIGEKLRYAYPLIQYKRINGKAAIVFVGDGVNAAADYFKSNTVEVSLNKRCVELELEHTDAHITTVNVWDDTFSYNIRKYLPLNSRNYAEYSKTDSMIDRYAIIERTLTGNILSFAKGIGLHVSERIDLKITNCGAPRTYIYKGVKMLGFDLEFKTNISLPDYIGLGKGASLGFGMIKKMKKQVKQ